MFNRIPNIDCINLKGQTPLIHAARFNFPEAIDFLLRNQSLTGIEGNSALIRLVQHLASPALEPHFALRYPDGHTRTPNANIPPCSIADAIASLVADTSDLNAVDALEMSTLMTLTVNVRRKGP